jgi:hypothetical protein
MQLGDDDVIEKSEDLVTKMLTREAKLEHDKCCAPARKMSQARTCPSLNTVLISDLNDSRFYQHIPAVEGISHINYSRCVYKGAIRSFS